MSKLVIHNLIQENLVHKDNRGWLVELAEFADGKGHKIENIHTGSISPGEIRANHFHNKQKEWIFVFGGKGIFVWREDSEVKQKKIEAGDKFLFEIDSGITHAIKNIDSHDIFLCAFTNQKYNAENPDRIFDEII